MQCIQFRQPVPLLPQRAAHLKLALVRRFHAVLDRLSTPGPLHYQA